MAGTVKTCPRCGVQAWDGDPLPLGCQRLVCRANHFDSADLEQLATVGVESLLSSKLAAAEAAYAAELDRREREIAELRAEVGWMKAILQAPAKRRRRRAD